MTVYKREVKTIEFSSEWAGRKISFETWKLAPQADSSVRFQYGDNVILNTVCMSKDPNLDSDFLPLLIDFRESYSAAGRIAWAVYRRREWKPSESAILYCRMADRALRPMFPKWLVNDVVISLTPMALDHEIELDVMTIIWSSVAIMAAWIPFDGPVWAVQLGYKDGQFIVNPTKQQIEEWILNLLVAWKRGSINMIECGSKEIPEDLLKEAFVLAQKEIDKSCDIQLEFLKKLEIPTPEVYYNKPSQIIEDEIAKIITPDRLDAMTWHTKVPFNTMFADYERECVEKLQEYIDDPENEEYTVNRVKMAFFDYVKHFIRERTLETGIRIDGRTPLDIRPLYCEVDNLPRVHGCGLFRRWDTQVENTVTLGWPTDYLVYDDMENDNVSQKYFHHYNFPPFSTWEAKWTRWQNRREIWHGKLAEKALVPVMPTSLEFPYSIRSVSECLSSGWSTSMGSVCSSCLALMDAWVPIKKPVAGIAMWLMTYNTDRDNITKHLVLNDLQWVEDFTWDMDFKVAGTVDGVTAIQLDTKLKWLTMDIVHETITRAIQWYKEIMWVMLEAMPEPRKQVKEFAPKIKVFQINPEKVKEVIGKWWEVINKIIEQCDNIKIDFEDDGTCYLTHSDQAMIEKAEKMIRDIALDLEVWQTYEAKISRIEDYGLFVDLPKWKKWLLHISDLWQKITDWLSKHFQIWQTMTVVIKEIDNMWRIKVKRKI